MEKMRVQNQALETPELEVEGGGETHHNQEATVSNVGGNQESIVS